MNNHKWTDEQRHRIVEIDTGQRTRGKHFMKIVKKRWHIEFPTIVETEQKLIDIAERFRKEGWRRPAMENDELAIAQIPLPK